MLGQYVNFLRNRGAMIALLCCMILLTSCSDNTQKTEGNELGEKSVTILHSLPNESLDPHNEWIALRAGITETLLRLDDNMQVAPWLAVKWEAKDDHTWQFIIRDGVTFQDGTKLDAAAAKASFERAIADSKALAAALKIQNMEASGQVITFTTSEPHPAFATELVHPTASIVSITAENKMGKAAFNKAPVGTGPFQVNGYIPGQEISLSRFDGYWDGKAKLSAVKFLFNADANVRTLAFQSKHADIVYHLAPEALGTIGQDPQLAVQSVPSLRTHYFTYNPKSTSVSDILVRKAIDKLIDRDTIVKDIMLGHANPSNGPFHSLLPFGNKGGYTKFNPQEALTLLASAGYKSNMNGKMEKNGNVLQLKLIAFSGINPELPLIPLLLQSEAAKIGVDIQILSVEYPDVYIKDHTDWDLSTSSYLTSPRGDGASFINAAYVPGGSYNPANIRLDQLDPIVKELNATSDVQTRNHLTQKAVQVINEANVHSFIIHPNILVGVNQRVLNWKPGAEEFYIVTNKMDVR
ncbi:nickel ABC transporter substrate-binding protein [Paenibacillus sp. UMB4589-SE434]|uniref:nickel ABC transporter substrate-binding protein n=1 Tax=Paenibacillus sp. UMB4589-SE434 TaxID=3046314 RepID=UPI00254D4ADA|nr:nickel ABC transporter substrate-binding protein [Paenibacillus sp. UMB4589-SE434]MDK8180232.1 ABC transporter substrate-binding protein [Paenibacillus sp. UMB4589-SE434]